MQEEKIKRDILRDRPKKGYLWGGRFKGVIIFKGEAQLTCSAYIDLNPVRAGLVDRPQIFACPHVLSLIYFLVSALFFC
jgi:putative transposase